MSSESIVLTKSQFIFDCDEVRIFCAVCELQNSFLQLRFCSPMQRQNEEQVHPKKPQNPQHVQKISWTGKGWAFSFADVSFSFLAYESNRYNEKNWWRYYD